MKKCKLLLLFLFVITTSSYAFADELEPLISFLEQVAKAHQEKIEAPVPIIAIGGCPGVGKSTFTKEVFKRLQERGVSCVILPQDHFNFSPTERKQFGTEWDIRHLQREKLHKALGSIVSGSKQIEKLYCNQLTGVTGIETLYLEGVDLVLFDGHYALCNKAPVDFFKYCIAGIYLEASPQDVILWKWEREQKKTIPRTEEQFEKHMEAIFLDFSEYVLESKNNALFILKKDASHHYTVLEQGKKAA